MREPIRYTELLLPDREPFSNYSFQDPKELNANNKISELSLVNIFIGSNNSGKSRFLRGIFSLKNKEFFYNTNKYLASDIINLVESFQTELKIIFKVDKTTLENSCKTVNGITSGEKDNLMTFLPMPQREFISVVSPLLTKFQQRLEEIDTHARINNINDGRTQYLSNYLDNEEEYQSIRIKLKELVDKYKQKIIKLDISPNIGDEKRYYIPILRGLRSFDDNQTDHYKEQTINDYFKNGFSEKMEVFSGLELYTNLKKLKLGNSEEKELVTKFESFISKKFFDSKSFTLTPRHQPEIVHIKIGDENEYPIYELGDGLQNLIICTFKIFTEKKRCLFFIEEPDMFMHPSFQRAFLEVLCEHDQHQYFITSHSNHFLDMTLDFEVMSVFHFSKENEFVEGKPNFKIRTSSTPPNRRLLFDLGVKNSSVFLSNSTIWVEGISDRLYLRAYMKKYIEELKDDNPDKQIFSSFREDYHYSFVEYQGTNLTHWDFEQNDENSDKMSATYICGNVFLIADGDISNKGKGGRADIYEKMLGDRFYKLPAKEIENLIPEKILQNLPSVIKNFTNNEISLEEINYKDYANLQQKGIGEYLDSFVGNFTFATKPDRKKSTTGTGTLKPYYKKKFYEETKKLVDDSTFEWSLTPELTKLCQKIFEHIKKHNPR